MVKLLAVADEVDRRLTAARLREIQPAIVVSCGDLPPDYLDFVCTAANAPLLYVPGNHDPDHRQAPNPHQITNIPPPPPGVNIDGSIVVDHGLRIAGLGGSVRYRPGPNQRTQAQMRRKVRSMIGRARIRGIGRVRPLDVFVAHAPPRRVGDEDDPAHQGFDAYHRLIEAFTPRVMIHGHIHPHGFSKPDRQIGETTIMNVIPSRIIELP